MIFLLLLIIVGIYLYNRNPSVNFNSSTYRNQRDNALEILRERYARGEIDTEEFQRLKRELY